MPSIHHLFQGREYWVMGTRSQWKERVEDKKTRQCKYFPPVSSSVLTPWYDSGCIMFDRFFNQGRSKSQKPHEILS